MKMREALALHRFEIMKRRGLPRKDISLEYQRRHYHAFSGHVGRVEQQNERLLTILSSILTKG